MDYTLMGLGSAYRGMAAAQAALNVMGNNVANANTEGYSRQRVEMAATPSIQLVAMSTPVSLAQIGNGVDIQQIHRLRDDFLEQKVRAETSTLGAYTTIQEQVNIIESQFQEPGDSGLSSVMTKFFNSWDELAAAPESSAARSLVREQGNALVNTLNTLDRNLNRLRVEADQMVTQKVAEVNDYLRQIASLNVQIAQTRVMGAEGNALMDRRDTVLEKLSGLLNIQTMNQADGKVFVYLQGRGLIDSDTDRPEELTTKANEEGKFRDVEFRGLGVDRRVLGGSLGALIQVRDEIIGRNKAEARPAFPALADTPEGMLYQLDELANKFAQKVNAWHEVGVGIQGSTGNAFFANNDGQASDQAYMGAGNLIVDLAIQNGFKGLDLIAAGHPVGMDADGNPLVDAGGNPVLPGPGDNGIAQKIAAIRAEMWKQEGLNTPNGTETVTLNDFYRSFLSNLGVTGQVADRTARNQTAVLDQLNTQRESTSGVNLDQEMSDMVRYQHAYNASAKVISMFDQMLDRLINGVAPGR